MNFLLLKANNNLAHYIVFVTKYLKLVIENHQTTLTISAIRWLFSTIITTTIVIS